MKSEKQIKQVALGNVDQLAGGDIHNTHVTIEVHQEAAPPESWISELECHQRFKQEVGIDCSYPARRQICDLLIQHNFTAREIRVTWKNDTLFFDDGARRLDVKISRAQIAIGLSIFWSCIVFAVVPLVFTFVVTPKASGAFLPAIACIVLMAAFFAKQFIEPNRIGKRLERILKYEG